MEKKEILLSLKSLDAPMSEIKSSLNENVWDSEVELVTLTRQDIANVLSRFLDHKLSATDLEDWADAIEGRDEIGFEEGHEDLLKDIIFELANPEIHEPLTHQLVVEMLERLK